MTPIFPLMTSKRGFSLIEVSIAVAVMAGSLVVLLPQVGRSQNQIKKTLRDLSSLNRTLYSVSRVQNRSYRLAFKTARDDPSYWVEVKKPLKASTLEDEGQVFVSFFKKDSSIIKDEKTLPKGVFFDIPEDENVLRDEVLYITYSPHFFSSEAKIAIRKIEDENQGWLLVFTPITGELKISQGLNQDT